MRVPRTIVLRLSLVGLLVGLLAVAGVLVWRAQRSALQQAMAALPAETLRASFTDWAAIRETLGDPGTRATRIERFIERAYDRDLSAASSIDESAAALQRHFGFSPATVDWEAYGQSSDGAAMVLQLPSSADMSVITDKLTDLGFQRPSTATGVWDGGIDLVAGIDPTITPELQYVVVLADEHRVVTSDTHDYAAHAARAARGADDSLADRVDDLVGQVSHTAAATLWAGDFACADLAMSQADAEDHRRAETLIERAGGVSPLRGLLMSQRPSGTLEVVLGFNDADVAAENLRPRGRLAVGEAVGRAGSLADTLRLVRSRTSGAQVLLTFRPVSQNGFVLSEVNQGPVLFASC